MTYRHIGVADERMMDSARALREAGTSKRDKHRYIRLTYDHQHLIMLPSELAMNLEDLGSVVYQTCEVWLTDEEYESLPEFQGW